MKSALLNKLLAFIRIIRPSNCLLAAFAVLVGFLLVVPEPNALLIFAIVSAFLICGAGIVMNDVFDVEMDRVNAPHRPIPAGVITRQHAVLYATLLFAVGLVLAAMINIACLLLATLNTVLELLYAWRVKRMLVLANLTDSWFPASSFLYGALAAGVLGSVIWLALLAFLSNMGREIFGDMQDVKGDSAANIRTIPIVLGDTKARVIGAVFILSAVVLSVLPFALDIFGLLYLAIVALADAIFMISIFVSPAVNQRLTKLAMFVALVAFFAGAFGDRLGF
jgi:geranylgeranylglycerol-phosphate geranylgeranyltransferase